MGQSPRHIWLGRCLLLIDLLGLYWLHSPEQVVDAPVKEPLVAWGANQWGKMITTTWWSSAYTDHHQPIIETYLPFVVMNRLTVIQQQMSCSLVSPITCQLSMEGGNCPLCEFAVWNVCKTPIIFDGLYHCDHFISWLQLMWWNIPKLVSLTNVSTRQWEMKGESQILALFISFWSPWGGYQPALSLNAYFSLGHGRLIFSMADLWYGSHPGGIGWWHTEL